MKSMKRAAQAGCIASFALLLAACDSSETPVEAQAPGTSGTENRIVYSEAFSDSGRFMIVQNPQGEFSYNIEARIGSKAQDLMSESSVQLTLADVYRSLHGGHPDVPTIVSEVSDKLGPQNPAGNAERPAASDGGLAKVASWNAFSSTYCVNYNENAYSWLGQGCFWLANDHYILTLWVSSAPGLTDRVTAYNNTPYTATLYLKKPDGSVPNAWRPKLAPYWVTWFQWGGTYSNAYAYMELPPGKTGELGIIDHYPVPRVR